MDPVNNPSEVKNCALRYLARRDYSRYELHLRLTQKGFDAELVEQVIESLQADGYQSDERFAEAYIRSRVSAGDGPFKIKISLRQKGVCDSLALAVIDRMDIDWLEQAQHLAQKRFGRIQTADTAELAKQVRYLKNKGYYQDDINQALLDSSVAY